MDDKGFLFNYFMKMIEDKMLAQRLRDIARMRNYFSGERGYSLSFFCGTQEPSLDNEERSHKLRKVEEKLRNGFGFL